jgi:hypothetical protein
MNLEETSINIYKPRFRQSASRFSARAIFCGGVFCVFLENASKLNNI